MEDGKGEKHPLWEGHPAPMRPRFLVNRTFIVRLMDVGSCRSLLTDRWRIFFGALIYRELGVIGAGCPSHIGFLSHMD